MLDDIQFLIDIDEEDDLVALDDDEVVLDEMVQMHFNLIVLLVELDDLELLVRYLVSVTDVYSELEVQVDAVCHTHTLDDENIVLMQISIDDEVEVVDTADVVDATE